MKIAVTSQGPDLDSPMDQRFGRCPYVLIVETDDLTFEAVKNPYLDESSGVGGRLASLIARHGATAVIAEECGPHAQAALDAAGIAMIAMCADTVRQAVEQYRNGRTATGAPSSATAPATGVNASPVLGGGRGGGGGRGRGRRGGGTGGGGGGGGGQRRRRRERWCWTN